MSSESEPLAGFEVEKVERYRRAESAAFLKTTEEWGDFSNMAGGFPLTVNGVKILTSEALYQACRFSHLPEVQREIIAQASPMTAKMKVKQHLKESRSDFDELRVPIMWWALRAKLACCFPGFSYILRKSEDRRIVEISSKDTFWGAKEDKAEPPGTLEGQNVLGRLLELLRERLREARPEELKVVEPPEISDFLLYGEPIRTVSGR